jgi:hypothetical protein
MNNNIQHISNRNQWYQPCFISSGGTGMLYVNGSEEII